MIKRRLRLKNLNLYFYDTGNCDFLYHKNAPRGCARAEMKMHLRARTGAQRVIK